MGKVAILFEDIKELELANLDVGHSATPTNKRTIVTSLIFRFVHKKKRKLDELVLHRQTDIVTCRAPVRAKIILII